MKVELSTLRTTLVFFHGLTWILGIFNQFAGLWTTSLNCNLMHFRAQASRAGPIPGLMALEVR